MINNVIWKDTIFSGTEDYLEYRISKNAVTPIYYGKAFRSPSSGRYEINISDKARSFLKPHISSSAWTTVDGVYETEDFAATFSIQDLANSAVSLEQFYLQYTTAEDFIGGAKITARPINGHIDPRMKMMWAKWDYMTRNVPVDKGYKYFDINIVSGSLDYEFSGGTNTVVFEATGPDYTITTDDDWIHITGGDGTYEITTDINTGETRTGYVCAQWYNAQFQLEEKCFEVTQGEEVFEFTYEGNTNFSYTGGTNVLSFTANTEIEIIYAPTWITSATVSGGETGTITLTATGNSFDSRIGTIRVRRKNYSSGHTAEIIVTQERVQLELTFSGDTVFEYSGGTINVAYTANTQFQTLAIPVWVNSVQIPSTLTGNIQITASSNADESQRNGSLIFYDGFDSSRTISLTITQKANSLYGDMYFTTRAQSDGAIRYSGVTWITYRLNGGEWKDIANGGPISVVSGDTVEWKNIRTKISYSQSCSIVATCNFEAYGNIMSLSRGDNFQNVSAITSTDYLSGKTQLNYSKFKAIFLNCTGLTNAKNLVLPATTLLEGCYQRMFDGCTSLTSVSTLPSLPATTLGVACYYQMFKGCTSLVNIPALPATTLANHCYCHMFEDCTSLTAAPELPVTTLGEYCYRGMFKGCTSLVNAPVLPVTALTLGSYDSMFSGCTSLTTAPVLPATTLAGFCYYEMFAGCTSLTTAPELPATTLADSYCYGNMFNGCTSLTTAPELPATTLGAACYYGMFGGCTSLTTSPELPATTLNTYCYANMFSGCTSLITAPELPVTTLGAACYTGMFAGCASLTSAPELPATVLTESCYQGMFEGCTSLTAAPDLLATALTPANCYYEMFRGCSSLQYVKCLAETFGSATYLNKWLLDVSSTGTFVKKAGVTWPSGTSGIPDGWTVIEE